MSAEGGSADRTAQIETAERLYRNADARINGVQTAAFALSREAESVLDDIAFLLRRERDQRALVAALREFAAQRLRAEIQTKEDIR